MLDRLSDAVEEGFKRIEHALERSTNPDHQEVEAMASVADAQAAWAAYKQAADQRFSELETAAAAVDAQPLVDEINAATSALNPPPPPQ